MSRNQKGYIYEASGAFFVRYYVTEIVDGEARRAQRSHQLCEKDSRYYAKNSRAVKQLRDEFMVAINKQQASTRGPVQHMHVVDFWTQEYLPYAKKELRPSTVKGYEILWARILEKHFADHTLDDYRTSDGSQLLTALKAKYGRRSLAHVRSLASGIFTYAVNRGFIETNPWHDAKPLGKVKAPGKTPHYTLEEAENVISALVDHVDCQLIMALACFLGLRPGEIAALKWEDFDDDFVHIRRAVVRGIVGDTKTPESVASLPLIGQVRIPLALWRRKCGNPLDGWVFKSRKNTPIDLHNVIARTIRPTLAEKGVPWKELYAGRRGAITAVIDLTNGNYAAGQELARHKSMKTTLDFYKKQTESALANGMRLLEAAASASK